MLKGAQMTEKSSENWFVTQLRPQGLRRAEENLARQGFESFCPKRLETVVKQGKRLAQQKPLFPGYLFVQFDPKSNGWTAINSTRGISRLILADIRKPTPLPSQFMAGLMARCDALGVVTAPPDLEVGDTIRVLSGPFAETVARIETLADDDRIRILMDLMGRETRISVSKSRVEKL